MKKIKFLNVFFLFFLSSLLLYFISAQSLASDSSKVVGLDVRSPGEVSSQPVPHSINIPMEKLESSSESVIPNKSDEIHVFCESGGRSKRAVLQLKKMGYKNVKDILTWREWVKRFK